MHQLAQRMALGAYRLVFVHALLRFAWGRRLFISRRGYVDVLFLPPEIRAKIGR